MIGVNMNSVSVQQLDNYRTDISNSLVKLSGYQQALVVEKSQLMVASDEASEYLANKDEVAQALAGIYSQTQATSKELYENLLTTQIKEIMPHNDECDRVVLNNSYKRGRPTLSIEVQTVSGKLRDVYLDKGGSIENLIAIGLRFICLCRTTNRRFLVLDEADAAVSPRYAESFASMLYSLSTMLGVQVIYITHKEPERFMGKGRIHHLKRKGGKIVSEVLSDIDHENIKVQGLDGSEESALHENIGIKHLRLTNFKQHENTYLELSPFVNYIVGDNDVGKTAIVQAIEAVMLNKGRDNQVRDNMDFLQVELGLEEDYTLSFKYSLKGKKKTLYQLFDENAEEINRSTSGEKVPEWLDEVLFMPLVNDVNIHISDQHDASFILDKSVSEHKKAEMLNLDDNSKKIQKMISRHHELVDMHRRNHLSSKQSLAKLDSKLLALREMEKSHADLEELDEAISTIKKNSESEKGLTDLIKQMEAEQSFIEAVSAVQSMKVESVEYYDTNELSQIVFEMEKIQSVMTEISNLKDMKVVVPEVVETTELESLINEMTTLNHTIRTLKSIEGVELPKPDVKPISELQEIISGIEDCKSTITLLSKLPKEFNLTPKVQNVNDIMSLISEINTVRSEIRTHGQNLKTEEANLNNAKRQKQVLLESTGFCPLCNQTIHKH